MNATATPIAAPAAPPASLFTIADLPKPEALPALYREFGLAPCSGHLTKPGGEVCVLGLFCVMNDKMKPSERWAWLYRVLGRGTVDSIYQGFDGISEMVSPIPNRAAYEYGRACHRAVFGE